jgi:cbb3-type cytochrome oxidase maturation protein
LARGGGHVELLASGYGKQFQAELAARMSIMIYLLLASLAASAGGLALFLWSLKNGQFDDLKGAANRILFDD